MALPQPLRVSVTPTELELVACQQLIEIVPLISMEKTAFISGAYGPLRPPHKAKIPIWMAVNLKLKKKCHIVPPAWLSKYLQSKLTLETTQPAFSDLPSDSLRLRNAPDDLDNPEKIRFILKDLREARQAKSRDGLRQLDHSELSLPNLCSMEINEIRPVSFNL
ncbi:Psf2-domain-containing protein [Panaeolus papilionaceus]|nr:Psf2-domain-containing protein [Panaeolus papilionaceus]